MYSYPDSHTLQLTHPVSIKLNGTSFLCYFDKVDSLTGEIKRKLVDEYEVRVTSKYFATERFELFGERIRWNFDCFSFDLRCAASTPTAKHQCANEL